jgi:D-glycero-alpha-D-manno-heptose 1-phosphate guanylyltransferase
MEAIILAGGLGTRLQGVIGTLPKCMAKVDGIPFLAYLFEYLKRQNCARVVLSLGYKHEVITEWLSSRDVPFDVSVAVEHEPMGTGGGILFAMQQASADDVLVLNGDTMFNVELHELMAFHKSKGAIATLALKEMRQFSRYGIVNLDRDAVITSFEEKQYREEGLINGGVYVLNRTTFIRKQLSDRFSMEKDYFEKYVAEGSFYGMASKGYFIDIGVPDDYQKAQHDFKTLFA